MKETIFNKKYKIGPYVLRLRTTLNLVENHETKDNFKWLFYNCQLQNGEETQGSSEISFLSDETFSWKVLDAKKGQANWLYLVANCLMWMNHREEIQAFVEKIHSLESVLLRRVTKAFEREARKNKKGLNGGVKSK